MFESGRPMPKASEVAQLREEIVALDAQISGRPVGSPPPRSAAVQPPPPGTHTHVRARTSTEEMALRAYEMVEQQLRSNQGLGAADDMADDIARLEAENSQLRVVAYDLLQRQHQLETLLAEVRGAQPPQLLIETTEDILNRMKAKLQKVVP